METLNFDTPDPLDQPEEQPDSGDFFDALGWHAASLVLPCASLTFYRHATRRKTGSAVLFFMLFMGIISILSTAGIYYKLSIVGAEIRGAFAAGKMPEVTISGGVAQVNGPQPAVLVDSSGNFVAIDTTGQVTSIDPTRYTSGVLLTGTELVVLSNNRQQQRIPLAQINSGLKIDPIIINAQTASDMWRNVSISFTLVALIGLLLWNLGLRMLYLLVLTVVVRGVVALVRSKQPFGFVLTLGIYASVPTLYLIYLLQRLGLSFFFLETIILVLVWAVAMYSALAAHGWDLFGPERPLRAWRAVIGAQMLIILALDLVFSFPNGGAIDLIAAAVTGILMVGVGMFTLQSGTDESKGTSVRNS